MKFSNQLTRFPSLLNIALLAGIWGIFPVNLQAAVPNEAQTNLVVTERLFASPDDAVKALQTATETKDTTALQEIFGQELQELLTGDKVQDANNAQKFADVMAQGCRCV